MKLAFCLPKYFPFGGLQRNFLRIAQYFQRHGCEIIVYTLIWEGDVPAGFQAHVIPVRARWNHARNAEFIAKVTPLLEQGVFDGIIGFMKMPGLDVYYAADPCFQAKVRRHRSPLYRLSPRYRQFVAFEEAVFHRNSGTEILMLTETEIDNYMDCYQTPRERFHLLPPGISRDYRAPDNAADIRDDFRREFGISEDQDLLLMVGTGFKTKGLSRSLRAMAALPRPLRDKTRLMVVGDGDGSAYERLAGRLGIQPQVRFMRGRTDVPRFLLGADLLLHPAHTENTGNVLLEAMISGLPVLTTANCGYAFHVECARAGVVVPVPFRQQDLDTALARMLVSPDRDTWSRNGIAYGRTADLYSRPRVVFDLVREILGRRGR